MHSHLESLEARTLMAFAGTFTDVDGDTYKVVLTGPGNAAVTTSNGGTSGFIQSLAVTGTTALSKLAISVTKAALGDGRVAAHSVNATVLRSATMPKVDINVNGGAFFTDVGQLALGNLADDSALEVTLAQSALNLGKRTASFGDIGDDVTMDFGNALASVSIGTSVNLDMFLGFGAASLTAKGDFKGMLNVDFGNLGQLRVGQTLRARASIAGDVKLITAAAFLAPQSGEFAADGAIKSIIVKGDLTASITAQSFGSISAINFGGSLQNLGTDNKGVAFKSIKFSGDALGGYIGVADFQAAAGTPGLIGSLSAKSWTAGIIREAAIGTFAIKNDMLNADIAFSGADVPLVIKSFTVGNGATGTIDFNGNAGAFKVGTAGLPAMRGNAQTNLSLSTESDMHGIKSITVTQPFDNKLSVEAGYIGTISSKAASTQLNIFLASSDSKGFALKSATFAGGVFDTLSAQGPNAKIGTLTVGSFGECTVDAGTFGTVTAKNKTVASAIHLTANTAPPTGSSIGTLDFRGGLDESYIRAAGSINNFSTLKFINDTRQFITAGRSAATNALPTDLSGFITASINQINITGAFGADPVLTAASFIADTIGKVTINGRTNNTGVNDGGADFGFAARNYGPFSLKLSTGQIFKPAIPTGTGDYNILAPDSNGHFVFRKIP